MKVKPVKKKLSKEEQELFDQQRIDYLTRSAAIILSGASVYYFFIKLLFL